MPMPPVSMISQKRSPCSTTVDTRSRVTPAVGSTMLILRPASQLKSDDLPTFGRPTIATIGSATTEPQEQQRRFPPRSGRGSEDRGQRAEGSMRRRGLSVLWLLFSVLWFSPQRIPAVHHNRRAGDVAR